MPISAERERELLNKYKLTSLHPTEWPHKDDESSEDEDDEASAINSRHKSVRSATSRNSRYQKLARHASLRSTTQTTVGVGVQNDEPDALGMAPSVSAELRRRGVPVDEDLALRNKFMLSSTSFSPAAYLSHLHQTASTEDLMQGLDFLTKSIAEKSASLKVLVESNFERFVRAKATIDTVYTEMRTQGVEEHNPSQLQPSAAPNGARPHSRQTSKGQTHFRNSSGAFATGGAKLAPTGKKKNALTKESEYGVQGIKVPLQEVAIKAEEVWGPALGGREKEGTLKAVMSAFEQHRDVFRLSGLVHEAVKKNDYDCVVDAYKQARSHADKARKIAAIAKEHNMELGDQDVHQIIVTARMWHDVTIQVDAFKNEIWRKLKTSHGRKAVAMVDEPDKELHMELIAVLLQLGVGESPIWVWINSRYLYLKDRIARSFERSRIEIEILRRRLAGITKVDIVALAKHLRSASTSTGSLRLNKESTQDLDSDIILAFWDKVQACLSALLSPQNGVLAEVLEWWEISQSFVDNKAQKSFPTAVFATGFTHLELEEEHISAIHASAFELVNMIRENIVSFFQDAPVDDISDLYSPIPPTPISPDTDGAHQFPPKRAFGIDHNNIPSASPKTDAAWEKYAFWPPGANSLSGAHYLARFSTLVGTAMSEIASLSPIKSVPDRREKLKSTIISVRERCIAAICASWNSDAEKCRVLESWTRSPERRDLTLMPAYFEAWEERVLTNVQKIAYISDAVVAKSNGGNAGVDVIPPPSAKLLQAVRTCFVTSLYKGLSGMVENATTTGSFESSSARLLDGGAAVEADPDGVTVARRRGVEGDGLGVLATEAVNASNRNVRMLITLSNLTHLRSEVIPQLISTFESAFSVKLTEESKTIRDVLSQIDSRLFQAYIKPTLAYISQTISDGVASSDWEPESTPHDARPYIYDVLIKLVFIHAEVTSTTTSTLTNQILSYLLEQSSLSLIASFEKRESYSLPALMQATLDVEFLAQTLNQYTTDKAGEVQSQIYLKLDERTGNEARGRLQGELAGGGVVVRVGCCFTRRTSSSGSAHVPAPSSSTTTTSSGLDSTPSEASATTGVQRWRSNVSEETGIVAGEGDHAFPLLDDGTVSEEIRKEGTPRPAGLKKVSWQRDSEVVFTVGALITDPGGAGGAAPADGHARVAQDPDAEEDPPAASLGAVEGPLTFIDAAAANMPPSPSASSRSRRIRRWASRTLEAMGIDADQQGGNGDEFPLRGAGMVQDVQEESSSSRHTEYTPPDGDLQFQIRPSESVNEHDEPVSAAEIAVAIATAATAVTAGAACAAHEAARKVALEAVRDAAHVVEPLGLDGTNERQSTSRLRNWGRNSWRRFRGELVWRGPGPGRLRHFGIQAAAALNAENVDGRATSTAAGVAAGDVLGGRNEGIK